MAGSRTPPPVATAFLHILAPHVESDLTIVCRGRGRGGACESNTAGGGLGGAAPGISDVRFYCHRAVLAARCVRFRAEAGGCCAGTGEVQRGAANDFREPPTKRRRVVEQIEADDDVVFEILRFVYCGTVHFPRRFLPRLGHLLAVADYFGVEGPLGSVAPDPGPPAPNGSGGLLLEVGMEHWLLALSSAELRASLTQPAEQDGAAASPGRASNAPLQTLARGFTSQRRVAVLATLARLRPADFSVKALAAQGGEEAEVLLRFHPDLVKLSVVNMAGDTVLGRLMDCSATVGEIRTIMYAANWAEDACVLLVFGGSVLSDCTKLQELGAAGFSCSLMLGMVRQPIKARYCLCRSAAQRHVLRKEGPNFGRAFLKCSGARGTQCPFFEWSD